MLYTPVDPSPLIGVLGYIFLNTERASSPLDFISFWKINALEFLPTKQAMSSNPQDSQTTVRKIFHCPQAYPPISWISAI